METATWNAGRSQGLEVGSPSCTSSCLISSRLSSPPQNILSGWTGSCIELPSSRFRRDSTLRSSVVRSYPSFIGEVTQQSVALGFQGGLPHQIIGELKSSAMCFDDVYVRETH